MRLALRASSGAGPSDKPTEPAKSEDYAAHIKALLGLQQASLAFPDCSGPDWLAFALELQQEMD